MKKEIGFLSHTTKNKETELFALSERIFWNVFGLFYNFFAIFYVVDFFTECVAVVLGTVHRRRWWGGRMEIHLPLAEKGVEGEREVSIKYNFPTQLTTGGQRCAW